MNAPFDRHQWRPGLEPTGVDGHGLGVLSDERCLQLLGSEPVGRVGFSAGSLPVVYPVNYFLDGRTIVFRSEPGQKLYAAEHDSVACLEIDRYDPLGHDGWSVLATGRLSLASPERAERLAGLPIAPWALAEASWFVELPIEVLSGRVIGVRSRGDG